MVRLCTHEEHDRGRARLHPHSDFTATSMEVILLRHGATDWNIQGRCQGSTDRELSETGVRQAKLVAASLSQRKISAVYSSGLLRARRTAQLISEPHGLAVHIEHDVRELDHGAVAHRRALACRRSSSVRVFGPEPGSSRNTTSPASLR